MPPTRLQPSLIKNKIKREEVVQKARKEKAKQKLARRLERQKHEEKNPALKKQRQAENVPRTLDNTREYDPSSLLTAHPSAAAAGPSNAAEDQAEVAATIETDFFADFFNTEDPTVPPKVLITTSPKASKPTFTFINELLSVLPGGKFIRRKAGKGFELGRIASWAAKREWDCMLVVNEDHGKPNAITLINLPEGPSAHFKLSSILHSKQISGHAAPTPHCPELILNGFTTRLGHTVGRFFQTLFPPLPEFQGRQVVTLHCQRDFLFFRRHRYAFRSTEKVALQEIGPRFTLKLRWIKKNIPAVQRFGAGPPPLSLGPEDDQEEQENDESDTQPAGQDEDDEDDEMPYTVPRRDKAKEATIILNTGDVDIPADQSMSSENVQDDLAPAASSNTSAKRKKRKFVEPPTQDEYLWAWKPELETTRKTFFL